MSKYDYSNGIVKKSDRKRLYFFEEITNMLIMYDSTSEDVNELIYWLYSLCRSVSYREYNIHNHNSKYELQTDKQLDENTFIRNIWDGDMIIYSIMSSICDNNSWIINDSLTEISRKIYFILDKIIHPDYRPGLDYENTRYYVEVEYINREKQKELNEKYNISFREQDWKA